MENMVSGKHYCNVKTSLQSAVSDATDCSSSWAHPLVYKKDSYSYPGFIYYCVFPISVKLRKFWWWWKLIHDLSLLNLCWTLPRLELVVASIFEWLNSSWARSAAKCGAMPFLIQEGRDTSEGFTWGLGYNKSAVRIHSGRSKCTTCRTTCLHQFCARPVPRPVPIPATGLAWPSYPALELIRKL